MKRLTLLAIFVPAAAMLLAGCPKRAQIKKSEQPQPIIQKAAQNEPGALKGPDYHEVPELAAVYFSYDKANLTPEARSVLKRNYKALTQHKNWQILVEGRCDERGTIEYNLALGQRRANAVAKYYSSLGVDPHRVETISYGKEKPVCEEHNEDCRRQNRQASGRARIQATETSSLP